MLPTQIRLILQPIADKLSNLGTKENIGSLVGDILLKHQDRSNKFLGYAVGNILNLLRHLNINLSNYDFSYQKVWQAWLQGYNLNNINFAFSDLKKSAFNKVLAIAIPNHL
jgi:hypothetical protein